VKALWPIGMTMMRVVFHIDLLIIAAVMTVPCGQLRE
jgi:hypothetical protein